jgi:hypothetical protein
VPRLACHYNDTRIAQILSRQARTTATGLSFTRQRVNALRQDHGIPAGPRPTTEEKHDAATMTLGEAQRALGVSGVTLYRWLRQGFIAGTQLTPGGPWHIRVDDELRAKDRSRDPTRLGDPQSKQQRSSTSRARLSLTASDAASSKPPKMSNADLRHPSCSLLASYRRQRRRNPAKPAIKTAAPARIINKSWASTSLYASRTHRNYQEQAPRVVAADAACATVKEGPPVGQRCDRVRPSCRRGGRAPSLLPPLVRVAVWIGQVRGPFLVFGRDAWPGGRERRYEATGTITSGVSPAGSASRSNAGEDKRSVRTAR